MSWMDKWELVDGGSHGAEGGQGTVRLVRDREGERQGALKEMHSNQQDNSGRRQRFAREVKALQRLTHPGVPRVIDDNTRFVDDKSVPLYLIQDWVDGRPLSAVSVRSLDEALMLTRRLLEIVIHLHEQGVVHRDIKPDNIIIGRDLTDLTLVDFGMSHVDFDVSPEDGFRDYRTGPGEELGNRFLRLPEHSAGGTMDDKRSDLTFVVAVLFFLLTKKAPRNLRTEKEQPPHRALASNVPKAIREDSRFPALEYVFDIGFQPSIAHRFQTAAQLREQLDRVLPPAETPNRLQQNDELFLQQQAKLAGRADWAIEKHVRQVASDLEEYMRGQLEKRGLTPVFLAGGPHSPTPLTYHSHWTVRLPDVPSVEVQAVHRIQPDESEAGRVRVFFHVSGEGTGTPCYYEGLYVSFHELQAAVEAQREGMLSDIIGTMAKRLEARSALNR